MSKRKQLMVLCSIIVSVMMVFAFSGCAKKAVSAGPSGTAADHEMSAAAKPAAQSGATSAAGSTAAASDTGAEGKGAASGAAGLLTEYTVKKGESLWWISKYKDIYDDPYLWPIIYQANKGQIKKPNLIYPGQKLKIPRTGISMAEIKKARKQAGAKKPYTPPKDSKPPVN